MTSPTPAELLDHARSLIEENGWWDGSDSFGGGPGSDRQCAYTALVRVARSRQAHDALTLALAALARHVPPPFRLADPYRSVVAFNDAPATTSEDVILLFKRAARALEQ